MLDKVSLRAIIKSLSRYLLTWVLCFKVVDSVLALLLLLVGLHDQHVAHLTTKQIIYWLKLV